MPTIEKSEGQKLEFKREWTERALEDLAAFANTDGGVLLLGIRRDGEIVGVRADDEEIQRIANQIAAYLGITPSIRVIDMDGKPVIEIEVAPSAGLVSYRGRYLRRVGSTNRDFSPDELARYILQRSGRSWDGLTSEWTLREVDEEALKRFDRLSRDRLPHFDPLDPERSLLNLGLLEDGRLKNAGVLLFGKRPQRLFPQARVRVGIFKGTEILDSHDFIGTLWEQLDGVMGYLRRVLKVRFDIRVEELSVEGIRRREVWEYPLEALREAVVNALIHRDYTYPADIQIRLEEDCLVIWSPGELPSPLKPEDLYESHPSVLRNPLIAEAFYFTGVIERWGTGTTRIVRLCREQGLPDPEFSNYQGGFRVAFMRDPYTPERLRKMGLNERQIEIIKILRTVESVSVGEIQKFFGNISTKTIQRDLQVLVKKGLVKATGKKKGRRYTLTH